MPLAAIIYETGFRIDGFLAAIAKTLAASGVRLGGVIQQTLSVPDQFCSRMILVDLANRRRFSISQDLGTGSQECRLDPGGLAGVAASFEATIDRVNFLILNKFGKGEANGDGLRSVFARAIEAGIPLLTAVRLP